MFPPCKWIAIPPVFLAPAEFLCLYINRALVKSGPFGTFEDWGVSRTPEITTQKGTAERDSFELSMGTSTVASQETHN
jgi:hypothetical protein